MLNKIYIYKKKEAYRTVYLQCNSLHGPLKSENDIENDGANKYFNPIITKFSIRILKSTINKCNYTIMKKANKQTNKQNERTNEQDIQQK